MYFDYNSDSSANVLSPKFEHPMGRNRSTGLAVALLPFVINVHSFVNVRGYTV